MRRAAPRDAPTLTGLVASTRAAFGQVGILVDDSPDARSRCARELYGGEDLPSWWLSACSIRCAEELLAAVQADLATDRKGSDRTVVVVDRFLPDLPPSGSGGRPSAPVGIDLPGRSGHSAQATEVRRSLRNRVEQLIDLSREAPRRLVVSLLTAYPHGPVTEPTQPGLDGPLLAWRGRDLESLVQLRPRAQGAARSGQLESELLRYGPWVGLGDGHRARADQLLEGADQAEDTPDWGVANDAFRAAGWRQTISALADAFAKRQSDTFVLLTGAGASLACSTIGAGMPPTARLLEDAGRALATDSSARLQAIGVLGDAAVGGALDFRCSVCPEGSAPAGDEPIVRVKTVDQLVAALQGGTPANRLAWRLEELFSRKEQSSVREAAFDDAFRHQLQRFDHGFPYAHWLLHRLPWTRVITTNFDGFHERAAYAAARTERDDLRRKRLIRLGNVAPESGGHEALYGLHKPYGSLLSPGRIALSRKEVGAMQKGFHKALADGVGKGGRGWLVVVGHSMHDQYIGRSVGQLEEQLNRSFEVVWVDPKALEYTFGAGEDLAKDRAWADVVEGRAKSFLKGSGDWASAGPLPATGLDFAFDLYTSYREAAGRR